MDDRLAAIQRALDDFRMDEARELAAAELDENPSASAYYLASQAARNHGQRVEYLERALELDPEHAPAREELRDMKPPAPAAADASAAEEPKLAGITRRFYALMIDACVISGMTLALLLADDAVATLQDAMYSVDEVAAAAVFRRFQQATIVVNLLFSVLYHALFMRVFNGRTPGKMVYRMRVVKLDGGRITILDALLRNVFGYAVSQLFLLGFIWAIVDDHQQAWHDKMARTIVVDEREEPESKEDQS